MMFDKDPIEHSIRLQQAKHRHNKKKRNVIYDGK